LHPDHAIKARAFEGSMIAPPDPDLAQRLSALRRALNTSDDEVAVARACAFLAAGTPLRPLSRLFEKAGRLGLLIEAVWRDRETALRRLGSVAEFLRLSDEAGMTARGAALVSELADAPPMPFSFSDYLGRGLGDRRLPALFKIKYRGWNDDPSLGIAERVEALALRCETQAAILDEVIRRAQPLDLPSWQHEMRIDQAYGHVFRDANIAGSLMKRLEGDADPFLAAFYGSLTHGLVEALADLDESRRRFAGLDLSRGLVLVTAHDLFSRIEVALADHVMPDSYAIHMKDLADPAGQRNAAFRALKTVTAGKAILLAPDGQQAAASAGAEIEVLGKRFDISVGAALIAYEGRSPTAFYRATRTGRRFVPTFVAGPSRENGESFAQFRTRWLAFYAAEREKALLASPGDLAFFLRNQSP
jgi:hypothetical protein